MKRLLYLLLCLPMLILSACDIHEFPEIPEQMPIHLTLHYDTKLTPWEHQYDGKNVTEVGMGTPYESRREYGNIRYVIRAYPVDAKKRNVENYSHEMILTRDIVDGYEHEVTFTLPVGEYTIMVWSDLYDGQQPYYNAENFHEIRLAGENRHGSNEFRDSFRGTSRVSVEADDTLREPQQVEILMQRPMAKYEFITGDIVEFAEKEAIRIAAKTEGTKADPTRINIEDYKVVFYYRGFVSTAYSMHEDIPSDGDTGIIYESSLTELSDTEASVGFDYVFVNGKVAEVTLQIGIYDSEGDEVALTERIVVPLRRNRHTIMTGNFLMTKASGGVSINPDYEDDYNKIYWTQEQNAINQQIN